MIEKVQYLEKVGFTKNESLHALRFEKGNLNHVSCKDLNIMHIFTKLVGVYPFLPCNYYLLRLWIFLLCNPIGQEKKFHGTQNFEFLNTHNFVYILVFIILSLGKDRCFKSEVVKK